MRGPSGPPAPASVLFSPPHLCLSPPAHTRDILADFGRLYDQQYKVALFNKVRLEIEGSGGPQSQLLHRKVPLEDKSIFSGGLYQYLEDSKKWRIRYYFIPDSYNIDCYENKMAHEKGLGPKGTISCAGYKVLSSMEEYLELLNNSLPGEGGSKAGGPPFLKCATEFPLLLWHPYARHHYFCVMTEKEHKKWLAVFQDCIRHANNGLSEECKVQTPAFTDSVRLYRQALGQYGTWDMMCGVPPQVRLKRKKSPKAQMRSYCDNALCSAPTYAILYMPLHIYMLCVCVCVCVCVYAHTCAHTHLCIVCVCKWPLFLLVPLIGHASNNTPPLLPRAMENLSDLSDGGWNGVFEGGNCSQHMEKVSLLAYHPVKMQSCYEKVEQLQLEGLQQRFDVCSPSVFIQRAQILMREQMDNAVFTFEQLLNQSLDGPEGEDLSKITNRCQERVIKKYDYDSSTVRKRFFKEALLQIIIPYMLKQLSPSCSEELPRFQELIFEDFSRFILVENIFEEVVLQSVMKDIITAVHEAAVQRRHNLFRDSMILTNSDPNLQLLGENPSIDWGAQRGRGKGGAESAELFRRRHQVVSMVKLDERDPSLQIPGQDWIPEEEGEEDGDEASTSPAFSPGLASSPGPDSNLGLASRPGPDSNLGLASRPGPDSNLGLASTLISASNLIPAFCSAPVSIPVPASNVESGTNLDPASSPDPTAILDPGSSLDPTSSPDPNTQMSPDSVHEIRHLINPFVEVLVPASEPDGPLLPNGIIPSGDGEDSVTNLCTTEWNPLQEAKGVLPGRSGKINEDESKNFTKADVQLETPMSGTELVHPTVNHQNDSGFQSPASEVLDEEERQPVSEVLKAEESTICPEMVKVMFESSDVAPPMESVA
uniref:Niban apoptosis regulator 2a n=1 Tax=Paramormyrops kingsleyae TaxID=1676925 RepID=A0A3B3SW03_9TELE